LHLVRRLDRKYPFGCRLAGEARHDLGRRRVVSPSVNLYVPQPALEELRETITVLFELATEIVWDADRDVDRHDSF